MNRFILKNTFIKTYIYLFLINIFIETRSQSCVLETVLLSKTTSFTSTEGVLNLLLYFSNCASYIYNFFMCAWQQGVFLFTNEVNRPGTSCHGIEPAVGPRCWYGMEYGV